MTCGSNCSAAYGAGSVICAGKRICVAAVVAVGPFCVECNIGSNSVAVEIPHVLAGAFLEPALEIVVFSSGSGRLGYLSAVGGFLLSGSGSVAVCVKGDGIFAHYQHYGVVFAVDYCVVWVIGVEISAVISVVCACEAYGSGTCGSGDSRYADVGICSRSVCINSQLAAVKEHIGVFAC